MSGWQLSCRGRGRVGGRPCYLGRGILVPAVGRTVLAVTGTVGWQVEVEGQGRGLLDTGWKQPPEQKRTGQIGGAACGSCFSCCMSEKKSSLNGSQCCIDFGSRAQVEGGRDVGRC